MGLFEPMDISIAWRQVGLRRKKWWRRWRSGAYDPTPVVRRLLTARLQEYCDAGSDDYFGDDLIRLKTTGRIEPTSRGALDTFFAITQDLRMPRPWIYRALIELGLINSTWLSKVWHEEIAALQEESGV